MDGLRVQTTDGNYVTVPRKPRVVAVGVPHHITHRGNDRQDVFFTEQNRAFYLDLLFEQSLGNGLSILGYCLMRNHVHVVAIPHSELSLQKTISGTHGQYARSVNSIRGRCGHLWQSRFYSCPMDEAHCWQALRYVECNPVRAGLVNDACEYLYSSARAHTALPYPARFNHNHQSSLELRSWRERYSPAEWRRVLTAGVADEALERRIQEATRRGRPMGSDEFSRIIQESRVSQNYVAEQRPLTRRKMSVRLTSTPLKTMTHVSRET